MIKHHADGLCKFTQIQLSSEIILTQNTHLVPSNFLLKLSLLGGKFDQNTFHLHRKFLGIMRVMMLEFTEMGCSSSMKLPMSW